MSLTRFSEVVVMLVVETVKVVLAVVVVVYRVSVSFGVS